jgi:alcohol dehydrogenase (NADP+)
MPVLGLGTWRAGPGEVGAAVSVALQTGYRHIDGAAVYRNESEVGAAVQHWLRQGGSTNKRENLFLTSKLWNTMHDPRDVAPALKRTLTDLQQPYVDLYLVHWPVSFRRTGGETGASVAPGGEEMYPKQLSVTGEAHTAFAEPAVPLADTWAAMLELKRKGLARDIGVSNCTSAQVEELVAKFGLADAPVCNQVESHVFCNQTGMAQRLAPLGVHLVAYSPLGNIHASPPSAGIRGSASATAEGAPPPPASPLQHPEVTSIAAELGVSPAQVLLHWNLQHGRAALSKSVRPERLRSNADLFSFELHADHMRRLDALGAPGASTRTRFLNPSSFRPQPHQYFFTDME